MSEKKEARKAMWLAKAGQEDADRGFIAGIPVNSSTHYRFDRTRCQRCGTQLFGKRVRIQERGPYCPECLRVMWLALHQVQELGEPYYLRTYGIGMAQYAEMFLDQDGCCAICDDRRILREGVKSLAVDHDHTTGVVRGLLCMRCNVAIGLMADDPQYLAKAARYLRA